jgi:hypothetical protein
VRLGTGANANALSTGGATQLVTPDVSPAYIGVGYILGPSVASLNFAGSLFAWGFMVPVLVYFLGPQLQTFLPPGAPVDTWAGTTVSVWRFIVRPIAVGGMLVGGRLHHVPHAGQDRARAGARRARAEGRGHGGAGGPNRALHGVQDGLHADRRDLHRHGPPSTSASPG